jgi:hypothetical protein
MSSVPKERPFFWFIWCFAWGLVQDMIQLRGVGMSAAKHAFMYALLPHKKQYTSISSEKRKKKQKGDE